MKIVIRKGRFAVHYLNDLHYSVKWLLSLSELFKKSYHTCDKNKAKNNNFKLFVGKAVKNELAKVSARKSNSNKDQNKIKVVCVYKTVITIDEGARGVNA